ncbi:AbrB family transcriptional regulator [Lentilactobacillus otakiensis]
MKRTALEKSDFWKVVDQQEKEYGSVDTPEVDWGEDVGSENFD